MHPAVQTNVKLVYSNGGNLRQHESQAVRGKSLPEYPILKAKILFVKKLKAKFENAGRAGSQHCHIRAFKDAKTSWMRIV